MLELYKNIKMRRKALGLTQEQLAHMLGYADKSMIARIEKGTIDLPQSKIFAFANVLHTTPSNLMGLDGIEDRSIYTTDEAEIQLVEGYRLASKQVKLAINALLNIEEDKKD